MLPYIILLLFPIILQHVHIKGVDYQKKNRFALAFFFFWLTVLLMLRHESVGNDTKNYIKSFTSIMHTSWDSINTINLESGFSYFSKLISLFSEEPQFFLAATALAITTMIYPTYKRLSVDSALTVVLFCTMSTFVMMFSGLRQMLAVGIGFIAYELTRRKKMIPFILAVCVAMSFHTSAFILAAMYPLYHAHITKKWLFAVVPVMAVIFIFNKPIFSVLSIIIERYTRFEAGISETGAYMMLFLFAIFAVFSFIIPDESHLDRETFGLRNILLFALVLQMFAPLHFLAMRMNYYYIIFIPLLLPKIVQCRGKRWNQIAVTARHIMVIFFLVYFFYSIYTNPSGTLYIFPYHFFWETV